MLGNLQQKKKDLDKQLLAAEKELNALNGRKEKYESNLIGIEKESKDIMQLKDKTEYDNLDKTEYDNLDKKINILLSQVKTAEIAVMLKNILSREKVNKYLQLNMEISGNKRNNALLKNTQEYIEKYGLETEFNAIVKKNIKESVDIRKDKTKITTNASYNNKLTHHDNLIKQGNEKQKESEILYDLLVKDTKKERLEEAKTFINLSLEKFVLGNKIFKLSESMLEYNKAKISQLYRENSLPEEFNVIEEINTIFDREIVQPSKQSLESAKAGLKNANDKIEEAKQKISSLKEEKKEILLSENNIKEDKGKIEGKIRNIDGEIGEKTNNKREIENAIIKAQNEYSTQKEKVAELQEKIRSDDTSQGKDQAEIGGNITQKIKEIDAHIAELKESIAYIDTRDQQSQSAIDGIKQQINDKINEVKQAEESVSSIERECAENLEIIEKLLKQRQESEKIQEQASNERERYAQLDRGMQKYLQPFRQRVENLVKQEKELSERYNQLEKEYNEYEDEIRKILNTSLETYLRFSRAAEESSGRKD